MIVVDTSALISIYLHEEDSIMFEKALFTNRIAVVAAPTALEFVMVAQSRRVTRRITASPDIVLTTHKVRVEPWTALHLVLARDAFTRFGKGQGHPAQLNFGDCMAYALARSLDAPLLYKGDDFARTDIRSAL